MFSHAFIRNVGLLIFYIGVMVIRRIQYQDQIGKLCIWLSILCSPFLYLLFVGHTWEQTGSPIQYYATYLIILYLNRENEALDRLVKSVASTVAIGYLYEVPKWIAISPLELIRSSQYSPVLFEMGFVSAEMGFVSALIYLRYYMDYKNNVPRFLTKYIYIVYTLVYIYDLGALWWCAYYLHIPSLPFKRLPSILLVLTHLKKAGYGKASNKP